MDGIAPFSWLYYPVIMGNAQAALGMESDSRGPTSPTYAVNPQRPQGLLSSVKSLSAIGYDIGLFTAHETGHQLSVPLMDCNDPPNRLPACGEDYVYQPTQRCKPRLVLRSSERDRSGPAPLVHTRTMRHQLLFAHEQIRDGRWEMSIGGMRTLLRARRSVLWLGDALFSVYGRCWSSSGRVGGTTPVSCKTLEHPLAIVNRALDRPFDFSATFDGNGTSR